MSDAALTQQGDDLKATITIAAPPEKVWALVSDPAQMHRWSPQVVRSVPLGRRVKVGTAFFNVNHDAWKVWPTTGEVVRYDAPREFAFRIPLNGTVWSFRLEPTAEGGTLVTEQRQAPGGIKPISGVLVNLALGGQKRFVPNLLEGMALTLERIKAAAEA